MRRLMLAATLAATMPVLAGATAAQAQYQYSSPYTQQQKPGGTLFGHDVTPEQMERDRATHAIFPPAEPYHPHKPPGYSPPASPPATEGFKPYEPPKMGSVYDNGPFSPEGEAKRRREEKKRQGF